MEGFSYVSDEMDLETGIITTKSVKQPIMSSHIKNELLFLDFDFNIDFGEIVQEAMNIDPNALFGMDLPVYKANN